MSVFEVPFNWFDNARYSYIDDQTRILLMSSREAGASGVEDITAEI